MEIGDVPRLTEASKVDGTQGEWRQDPRLTRSDFAVVDGDGGGGQPHESSYQQRLVG